MKVKGNRKKIKMESGLLNPFHDEYDERFGNYNHSLDIMDTFNDILPSSLANHDTFFAGGNQLDNNCFYISDNDSNFFNGVNDTSNPPLFEETEYNSTPAFEIISIDPNCEYDDEDESEVYIDESDIEPSQNIIEDGHNDWNSDVENDEIIDNIDEEIFNEFEEENVDKFEEYDNGIIDQEVHEGENYLQCSKEDVNSEDVYVQTAVPLQNEDNNESDSDSGSSTSSSSSSSSDSSDSDSGSSSSSDSDSESDNDEVSYDNSSATVNKIDGSVLPNVEIQNLGYLADNANYSTYNIESNEVNLNNNDNQQSENNDKRRNCTKRIIVKDDPDSDISDVDIETIADFNTPIKKEVCDDNIKSDPTWIPALENIGTTRKQTQSNNMKRKPITLTISKKSLTSFVTKNQMGEDITNSKKSGVKAEHDYCSPVKKGSDQSKNISKFKPESLHTDFGYAVDNITVVPQSIIGNILSCDDNESESNWSINQNNSNHTKVKTNNVVIDNVKLEESINKVKKKLNLAEYKMRNVNNSKLNDEAVNGRKFIDPILEAKRKMLRIQELKKAKIEKSLDIPVIENVPMEMVPLSELTNCHKTEIDERGNDVIDKKSKSQSNSKYETITLVSCSTCTDVSIPVNVKDDTFPIGNNYENNLMNNNLLENINDTINKVKSAVGCEQSMNIISSNSLISSIQDVVIRKSSKLLNQPNNISQYQITSPPVGVSPPSALSPNKPEMSHSEHDYYLNECIQQELQKDNTTDKPEVDDHGEDKIILHLDRNAIKPKTKDMEIQTISLPMFAPLKKLSPRHSTNRDRDGYRRRSNSKDHERRKYRSRSRSSRRSFSISPMRNYDYKSRNNRNLSSNASKNNPSRSSISPASRSRFTSNGPTKSTSRDYLPPVDDKNNNKRSPSRCSGISNNNSRYHKRSISRSSGRCSVSPENYRYRNNKSGNYDRPPRRRNSTSSDRSSSSSGSSRTSSRSRSRSRPRSNNKKQWQTMEERTIVYVGRIEDSTTKNDIKRKFGAYGFIKQVSFHYKDTGMKYGFVTFRRPEDAYKAIDAGQRDQTISMYDISFGARRAFCRQKYSDLDGSSAASTNYTPFATSGKSNNKKSGESFEDLLNKVKKEIINKIPRNS